MGVEITKETFSQEDKKLFRQKLEAETALLKEWFEQGKLEEVKTPSCGFELEGWLVDENFLPAPKADSFLEKVESPLAVPEISLFNFELNAEPAKLTGSVLYNLHENLKKVWGQCQRGANDLGLKCLMIGSLPTLKKEMLELDYLYPHKRYLALNNVLLGLKKNREIDIAIKGKEELSTTFHNVMIEAATTSFQVHLEIPLSQGVQYYNASLFLSAFSVALSANSPFLFGKTLWSETRVPIFEQAVRLVDKIHKDGESNLGRGYLENSLFELFQENLNGYQTLLPMVVDSSPEEMKHLSLHNGTVWRWNRPIIGFNSEGVPHCRIEHRVQSAGPTAVDMIANMAFYIGAVGYIVEKYGNMKNIFSFEDAKNLFYQASQKGVNATLSWNGKDTTVQEVLVDEFIEGAYHNLLAKGLAKEELEFYFYDVLIPRVRSGQIASNWQRAFVNTNGKRYQELLENYFDYQEQDLPVHKWKF